MPVYEVNISLSREKMLLVYKGAAHTVVARSRCGKVIQLSARHLLPFLDRSGVHGSFRLTLSDDNRLVDIGRSS